MNQVLQIIGVDHSSQSHLVVPAPELGWSPEHLLPNLRRKKLCSKESQEMYLLEVLVLHVQSHLYCCLIAQGARLCQTLKTPAGFKSKHLSISNHIKGCKVLYVCLSLILEEKNYLRASPQMICMGCPSRATELPAPCGRSLSCPSPFLSKNQNPPSRLPKFCYRIYVGNL